MVELVKNKKEEINNASEPEKRTVDLQVDTISSDNGVRAYYNYANNAVTVNHPKNADNHIESDLPIIHEQKHRDNQMQGIYAMPVSPEQTYKLNMHDEISANMCELIALRDKYIKTGDISVFDNEERFSFYKEAIVEGRVNPNSPYKEDFNKDMLLIANGTKKMWQQKYGNKYIDNCVKNSVNRADTEGTYAKYHDENYEKAKKTIYNIGGVDFTQYMYQDVQVSAKGKKALNKALKEGACRPEGTYQKFLAASCDFLGSGPKHKTEVMECAQGKKGISGRIVAPLGATVASFADGTANYVKKLYHKVVSPENQPINPINTDKAVYREWKNEDGSRVSEVQYRQILDMNKDVIKKPTKSYRTGKNDVLTKMKDDAVKAQTLQTKIVSSASKDKSISTKQTQKSAAQTATPENVKKSTLKNDNMQIFRNLYDKVFGD